ncbi:MFS transporter [Lusitaniella coriacea]|uniref:MFS transporter n=1 Tax=Lusitaniella coriacea TaxID=1983105 RepID=UPI003CF571FB
MRTFTIIWLGQLVSTIGSYMSEFALSIWAWQLTQSATALALVALFSQLPRIPMTLFAGAIADRFNRKRLMMLGDAIAAISTLAILSLYFTDNLQIWHLYLISAIKGGFEQLQWLAYETSLTMIVPQRHYTRASSMGSMVHYGSSILSPALAGSLYPVIGLVGILLVDLATFVCAIASLVSVRIPQPSKPTDNPNPETIWQEIASGYHYILIRPGLCALLTVTALFWFAHDIGAALYDPMILARTGGDALVLGTVGAAAGVGGVAGALILSAWGGFKRRLDGVLLGFIGAGLSKTAFGFGQTLKVWIPAQFCSSSNFPLLGSHQTAIWLAQVAPAMQGRVFAAKSLVLQVVSAIAALIAGPLADRIFEPAMMSGGVLAPFFGGIFGTGRGAGMALLYVISSVSLLLVGVGGYALPVLRGVEEGVTDSDAFNV